MMGLVDADERRAVLIIPASHPRPKKVRGDLQVPHPPQQEPGTVEEPRLCGEERVHPRCCQGHHPRRWPVSVNLP